MSCPFNNKFPWIHLNEAGKKIPWPAIGQTFLKGAPSIPQKCHTWIDMCASACKGKHETLRRQTKTCASEGNHQQHYSPYPGVPPERKMAELHHGPVTGNTWTVSRLHNEAVSGLTSQPVNLFTRELLFSYLSESTSPFTTRSVPQSRMLPDSPIQASPLAKNPFQTSNWT